ncbi:MAG: L,D-transpeptidase [Anaerolineales bacterium]
MTRWPTLIPWLLLLIAWPSPTLASDGSIIEPLCTARILLRAPERCRTPIGPAAALLERTRADPPPLPTRSIDPTLGQMPFDYLNALDQIDLYPTAASAAQRGDARTTQPAGFVYLAAADDLRIGSAHVYLTPRGYARASRLRQATISDFHGLAFFRTPSRPFGWLAAGGICPRPRPSMSSPFGSRCYTRYRQVPILSETESDGIRWLQIGEGEWVDADYVAEVYPADPPADMLAVNRWVDVNLAEQVVRAYQDGQLVYVTLASTGRTGFWTRPGTFQVWIKLQADDMSGGSAGSSYYFLERVPWVLYFDQARALHGTYWHNRFGEPSSHGCVNLSPTDAHWFFNFAEVGTYIHVWDPTGQTPTDPATYGPGGA